MLSAAHRGAELLSDTLVTVCSGQSLTAKLRTSTRIALPVHNMPSSILGTLTPHPVPTVSWLQVFQDLFTLNGDAYLVTVDHYSNYHEPDRLPSFQAWSVVQATKQHFGRLGIPHTLITDCGGHLFSRHSRHLKRIITLIAITSSHYWSQPTTR